MKKQANKIISICLVLMLVAQSFIGIDTVYAEDTVISKIYLTMDKDLIDLNTAWTEGEVNSRIYSTEGIATNTTEGCRLEDLGLRFFDSYNKQHNGIGDGSNYISAEKIYSVEYELYPENGYTWNSELESCTRYSNTALITECPSCEVYVNGVKRSDVYVRYMGYDNVKRLLLMVGCGEVSTNPIVKTINIKDNDMSLAVGETHKFEGEVTGTVEDKSIVWSVEGNNSSSTKISADGTLIVGSDETAETLTVKASAKADNKKFDSKTVIVLKDAPTIDSVSISPSENVSVLQKKTKQFNVEVTGTQTDKTVTWELSGNKSIDTTISTDGLLTVARDETAETLTVKATANKDTTKYDTVSVKVIQNTRVNSVDLTYNLDEIEAACVSTNTEGKLRNIINGNVDITNDNCNNAGNDLFYLYSEKNWYGIGDGTNPYSDEKEYFIEYNISPKDGYDWPEEIISLTNATKETELDDFSVSVNGVFLDGVWIEYNKAWNCVEILVPLSERVDIAETTVSDIEPVTYNGKEQTPDVEVKQNGNTLIKDKDYTVSYSDNVDVGTASVLITGIGMCKGSKTVTFKINKAEQTVTTSDEDNNTNKNDKNSNKASKDNVTEDKKIEGTVLTDKNGKAKYKIISAYKKNDMPVVEYVATTDKKTKKLVIPDTVVIDGVKYKIESIGVGAFKNNKDLTSVIIGKNVKKIGKKAFFGCKKLKSIIIKTKKLKKKSIGANAFKGINKKAKFKVPKKKLKLYKKLIKKAKAPKKCKITK